MMGERGASAPAWARGLCAGLWTAGCREVVYVPDNPLSHVLRALADEFPAINTRLATREEEAVGIAAGLHLGGARPAVMMQSSGLGNAINALASLAIPFQIPLLLIISVRGEAGEWNPSQMPLGTAIRPILDSLGIRHVTLDRPSAVAPGVHEAVGFAAANRAPSACLLARRLTAGGDGGRRS